MCPPCPCSSLFIFFPSEPLPHPPRPPSRSSATSLPTSHPRRMSPPSPNFADARPRRLPCPSECPTHRSAAAPLPRSPPANPPLPSCRGRPPAGRPSIYGRRRPPTLTAISVAASHSAHRLPATPVSAPFFPCIGNVCAANLISTRAPDKIWAVQYHSISHIQNVFQCS